MKSIDMTVDTRSLDSFLEEYTLSGLYEMDKGELLTLYSGKVLGVYQEALQLTNSYKRIQKSIKRKDRKQCIDAFDKYISLFSALVLALSKKGLYDHAHACSTVLQLVQNQYTQMVYVKQKQDSDLALRLTVILWFLSLGLSMFLPHFSKNETSSETNNPETQAVRVEAPAEPMDSASGTELLLDNPNSNE